MWPEASRDQTLTVVPLSSLPSGRGAATGCASGAARAAARAATGPASGRGSEVQVGPQPSPPTVLLSSQPSAKGPQVTRRPSPQIGAHVSTPPMPEPTAIDETHAKPSSMRQSASQPSPPAVILSSHASAVERMPLPQTCTTGTTATASSSVPVPLAAASSATVATVESRASSDWSLGSKGDSPSLAVTTPKRSATDRRRRPPGCN
eukprot:Transcript_7594.p2 GENE.Transcript_7594~~Transcript_7594.p2  ORF type:complete len:206 (-),score=4.41 Transcript_7594:170-787(-)